MGQLISETLFSSTVIVAVIGLFSGLALAFLGWFLYRPKHVADVLGIKATAKKTEADAHLIEAQAEIERDKLPTDEQRKIRYQSVKQEDLWKFIDAHNKQTEQYTALITKASELQETCAETKEQLGRSETLREYFEEKLKETEKNWQETIEESKQLRQQLTSCRSERDDFEKAAARVGELEERVTKSEDRVTALEKVLTDNKIPFEHI